MALILRGRTTLAGATTVGWSPAALFAAGEQGAWFDPSDFERYMATTGANLAPNGDFSNGTTGWAGAAATLSVVNGALRITVSNVNGQARSDGFATVIGKRYRITGQLLGSTITGAANRLYVGSTTGGNEYLNLPAFTLGQFNYSGVFVATTTTTYITFIVAATSDTGYSDIDNISVQEMTDAYSTATMFTDTAGTTPVTAVGQQVARINDKSGRGNHATQATLGFRPTLQVENGRYYLAFDGSNDSMSAAVDKTAWTDAIAITGGLSTGGTGALLSGLDAAPASNHEPFNGDNLWYCAFGSATRVNSITTLAYNTAYVLTRMRLSASTTFRRNGAAVGTPSGNATTFGGANPILLGTNGVTPLAGRIYSVVIRAASTTATDIARTERYVANRTGVAL